MQAILKLYIVILIFDFSIFIFKPLWLLPSISLPFSLSWHGRPKFEHLCIYRKRYILDVSNAPRRNLCTRKNGPLSKRNETGDYPYDPYWRAFELPWFKSLHYFNKFANISPRPDSLRRIGVDK